jgi:8-oxo-dGTP diphosphatase
VQNISTPLLVVAVALIGTDGLVLLQRRPSDAVHGSLWEFPGGKVEPGETTEAALVREICEELSLVLAEGDLQPLTFISGETEMAGGNRPIVILLYTCTVWQGLPRCIAGSEIGWFKAGEIGSLAMPPLDYPLAAQLAKAMAGRA